MTRAALAFAFELTVRDGSGHRHSLRGSASLIVTGLEAQPKHPFHFDLDADLEQTGTLRVIEARMCQETPLGPDEAALSWGVK